MVHKGLYFCKRCGAFGSRKLQNLAKVCDPVGRDANDTERKRKLVIDHLQGKLPKGFNAFPNAAAKLLELEQ